jgi:zinc and cadmium transporter
MSPFFASLSAAFLISLISLVGVFFIFIKSKVLNKITLFLVSFAIGALLGDAFIHLIPQSFNQISSTLISSLLILGGILLFFILEKVLRWRHCHQINCCQHEDHHSHDNDHIITLNLFGDTVHNFIDGMLIAASFMVSFSVGLATSIAVLIHEIPQEIGDFGIFLHSGLSKTKAIFYNFLSALASLIGVVLTFLIGQNFNNFSHFLIPITAGGFIYLAATDLIPELHRHDTKIINSLIQLIFIILGITLMSLLIFLE